MVNARAVLKACSVVTIVSASECTDESCKSETATMLQTRKRGGQISTNQKTVADLRKSTLKLLKDGGTKEVVEWAETALHEISNDVEVAIEDSHKVDQQLVLETVGHFTTIANQFAEKVTRLDELRENHRDKSSLHSTCRGQEALDCEAHTNCRIEEERLKNLKDNAHSHFQSTVNSVKHCNGDTTDPMHTQETKHNDYVSAGQAFFDAWDTYEAKHTECNGLNTVLDEQTLKCNGLKQEFESASCTSHDHFTMSYDNMVDSWELQATQYASVKSTVGTDAADRKIEFETLAEVKCLLAKVQERGGKPCDEEEVEGESAKIEQHCQDEAKDSSHLDIDFPEPDPRPVRPVEEPYPCTPEFVAEEYNDLTGHCFDNLPECMACDGSSVHHHARTTFHNVCIAPNADKFATLHLEEVTCVSNIHFTHVSGKVSCSSNGDSNWGCGNDVGLVITDESKVTAPVYDTVNGLTPHYSTHAHWYSMQGVSGGTSSMDWVFKEPYQFGAKDYKLWYNEDLTGGTEEDNHGEACYDVVMHKSQSCNALAPLQFRNVCTSATGGQHGSINLPPDTCVTEIDIHWISGHVSCNGDGNSNFGCGDNHIGLVWTNGGTNEIVMPKENEVEGVTLSGSDQAHWYTMHGVGKTTQTLPMKLLNAPLKVSGELDLWYNEDLTDSTESDNHGTACYEVAVHRALSC